MKKLIVVMLVMSFLVFSGAASAQNGGYMEVKIHSDSIGNFEVSKNSASVDEDVDVGITLSGEYKVPMDSQWTLGGGIAYQLERAIDEPGAENFNFMPIYGIAQYNLVNSPSYLLGKLGFNTMNLDNLGSDADENSGLYYAIGAGKSFGQNNEYVFEGLYSVNNGEIEENTGETFDVSYSKFTVSIGRKF